MEVEKKEIGTLHVTLEPADSKLSIDDAAVTLPANGDLYVDPGTHRTTVTHECYDPNQQTVHVSKGTSQVLWIKLSEVGAPPPAVVPAESAQAPSYSAPPKLEYSPSRSIVPAVVGGGLVVAGAAVGVVFLLAGNSKQHDTDQANAGDGGRGGDGGHGGNGAAGNGGPSIAVVYSGSKPVELHAPVLTHADVAAPGGLGGQFGAPQDYGPNGIAGTLAAEYEQN